MLSLVPLSAGLIEHLALVAGAAGVGVQLPTIISNVTSALAPHVAAPATSSNASSPVVATLTYSQFATLTPASQTAFLQSGGHIVGQ